MKIIKQIADNVVLFAEPDLMLDQTGCSGAGWAFRSINPSELVLEEAAEIPDGFVCGGWTYSNGTWATNDIGEQALLPAKRTAKIAELEAARLTVEYSNITHAGQTWKADKISRDLLGQVLAVGSVPSGMYWRDAAGTPRAMTYTDLQALGRAILDRGFLADQNLETKKAAVAAAATAAEIMAITW
ncbi:MAG: DUF4376 domain-containing protein [Proteobacteria bacterium]|nr:DUF4376 domain-containing protein [Pseudomonadota bacterium]